MCCSGGTNFLSHFSFTAMKLAFCLSVKITHSTTTVFPQMFLSADRFDLESARWTWNQYCNLQKYGKDCSITALTMQFVIAVTIRDCIQGVIGSNPSTNSGYSDWGFSSVYPSNYRSRPSICSWLLPSESFPIHHPSVFLTFDDMSSKYWQRLKTVEGEKEKKREEN